MNQVLFLEMLQTFREGKEFRFQVLGMLIMQGFDQYSFGEIMQIETLSEARDQEKKKKALLIRVTQQNQQVYISQKKFQ